MRTRISHRLQSDPKMANNASILSSSASSLSSSESQDPNLTAEDDFKNLIVDISDNLAKEDLHKLRYCYKRHLGGRRQKLTALQILEKLEEKGFFSHQCVFPLKELLRRIPRYDLLSLVDSYAKKHSDILSDDQKGESLRDV